MKAHVEWMGPFAWSKDGLVGGVLDPVASEVQLKKLLGRGGLYMLIGDHPVHGDRALLYLGETARFSRRLEQHAEWIAEEWRVGIYLGIVEPARLRERVEQFLIYAHSPAYNARSKHGGGSRGALQIWNVGRFHRLLPELSSTHPWFA